ncbi:uncharacterized protein [Dermacentor albipictus]|uniref:uncharacterized protein isoform X2 n=1 Tax=Dermacentor albipictus TaxID=60249 RepID=UPI0038FBE7D0
MSAPSTLLPPRKPLDPSADAWLGRKPWKYVFSGLGQLKGEEYTMQLNPGAVGVVVPARRVPVALQDKVKEALLRMEEQGVIAKRDVCYLGHVLSAEGLRVDAQRVQDILEMPTPRNSSQRSLQDLLAATNDEDTLVKLREYANTTWPLHKQEVPEPLMSYWAYPDEIHAQDGLVFRSNKSPVQRLMGRQTRTLLSVPTSHLAPRTIPPDVVQGRLQEIRQRQRTYYNRGSRNLPPVMPGQQVTVYETNERTWSPAVFLRPADEHRSTIVKTEDGRELRRTGEHLRLVDPQPEASLLPEDVSSTKPPQELRRSTRLQREPCRYP